VRVAKASDLPPPAAGNPPQIIHSTPLRAIGITQRDLCLYIVYSPGSPLPILPPASSSLRPYILYIFISYIIPRPRDLPLASSPLSGFHQSINTTLRPLLDINDTCTMTMNGISDNKSAMPHASNDSPSVSTKTIEQGLRALGLPQYIEPCRKSGVSSWATLSQLSEPDFENLGISLGHRRKLQRAFAQQHFWPDYLPLPTEKEIQGFPSFPFESSSLSGSDNSTSPQSSSVGFPSQPTSATAQTGPSGTDLGPGGAPELGLRQRVSIWVDNRY